MTVADHITSGEAAKLLGISPREVQRLAKRRGWQPEKIHERLYLWKRSDIEAELEKRGRPRTAGKE